MNLKRQAKIVRATFFTGLAVVLPAALSVAVFVWLFGTVSNFTDTLLFFFPRHWNYVELPNGSEALRWHASYLAFATAILLILFVGRLTRLYIGRRLIHGVDRVMLKVPLLNRIYGTIKQVNEAFTTDSKGNFKQVVLVPFPSRELYSVGFLTAEQTQEVGQVLGGDIVSVFVPTTPNPTTGFLLMLKDSQIRRLNMSVADGIKLIISLGSVSPAYGDGDGGGALAGAAVVSKELAAELD